MTRSPFLLTVRQASRQLGVPRRVLREMIDLGQIPVYRERDRVFVDPLAVRAILDRAR